MVLFAPRPHVGDVVALTDGLLGRMTGKAGVGTQVLRRLGGNRGAGGHQGVQDRFQLRDIMPIGPSHDERERGAMRVHQEHALGPIFSPDRSGLAPPTPAPAGL